MVEEEAHPVNYVVLIIIILIVTILAISILYILSPGARKMLSSIIWWIPGLGGLARALLPQGLIT